MTTLDTGKSFYRIGKQNLKKKPKVMEREFLSARAKESS